MTPEALEVMARTKYVSMSPQKVRLVVDLVRGMPVNEALETLRFVQYGVSFWTSLLPFADQANVYNKLVPTPTGGTGGFGNVGTHTTNGGALNGVVPPYMICPSSPLANKIVGTHLTKAPAGLCLPSYVGISGNLDLDTSTSTSYGIHSSSGILHPNSRVRFRDLTDGASNTIIVGEQSQSTSDQEDVLRGFWKWGAWVGSQRLNYPGIDSTSWPATGSGAVTYNITTIRYRLNYRPSSATAIGSNGMDNGGANSPIISTHTGGAFVLLADGHTRFLSESINFETFKNLAAKSDGNVLGEY